MNRNIREMLNNDEYKPLIVNKQNRYDNDCNNNNQRSPSRLEWAEASWNRLFYLLTWWWINPIILLGYKRPLIDEDLDSLPHTDKAFTLLNKLSRYNWQESTTLKIIIKSFWKQSLLIGLLLLPRMTVRIGKSLIIRNIVFYIKNYQILSLSITTGYLYAIALLICTLIEVCILHYFVFQSSRIGLQIRNVLTSIIYKHSLSINIVSFQKTTTAKIINLIAHDAAKFEQLNTSIHYIWAAPLEALVVFIILCWIIKPLFVLIGYSILIILTSLQIFFSRKFSRYYLSAAIFTDQRIHAYNELIQGYQIIKMYNWEKSMEERILQIRQREFIDIQHAFRLRALNIGSSFLATSLMALSTFGSMWLFDYSLEAANIFTVLSMYNQIRMPVLRYLPPAIEKLSEVWIASKRIDEFMNLPMVQNKTSLTMFSGDMYNAEKGKIIMHNASFSWQDSDVCLSSLNIEIESGTFVGIIGSVGSGKSSLLSAILGEMILNHGQLNINNSSFSHVSQSSWILPDTLRSNILFGRPFHEQRYLTIIRACCLDVDIETFGPSGDLTVIDEKGINLSGGQKARISLARALYTDADIYLLDDPLASVDPKVARHIYEQCVGPNSLLSKKTRLLVTYQIQFLSESHLIIVLADGHIQTQGRFDQLSIQHENIDQIETTNFDQETVSDSKLDIRHSTIDTQSIISDEKSLNDATSWSTWYSLIAGSPLNSFRLYFVIIFLIAGEVFYDVSNYWLSQWSKQSYINQQYQLMNVYIYLGLSLITAIIALIRVHYFFNLILNGSNQLHNTMLTGLLYTSIQFYESNPSGRILNRVSKDQKVIDEQLGIILFDAIQSLLMTIGLIVIIGIVNWWVLLLLIPLVPIFWILSHIYLKTSRQLKRLESITRSPIYTHFSSSLNGLVTIRAFKVEDDFLQSLTNKIDANTRSYIILIATNIWLGFYLDLMATFFSFVTAILAIILRDQLNPAYVALSLSYSINMTVLFQWGIRQLLESETLMTSAERINEYARLPPEEDESGQKRLIKTLPDWPTSGIIEFRNYSFRYTSDLKSALKNINLNIASNEKIGIIGRTGSGKSSLFQALFRFINRSMTDGEILIDHVDISRITLKHLRSHLSVIPQQPFLFSGTLRYNLDPLNQYSDEECWMALKAVQLDQSIFNQQSSLLLYPIAESGSNLSVGQCQLICVARAILKKSKILLIDEATANVDKETDALVQKVIQEKFRDRTILTIAHRINTVASSDRLIVMNKGRIININTCNDILSRP
ncbi:unnamed protein product [Adineta steineri]|uniref:Uncharacterized protein n=1 Tax=Adineta steineri TaxID=433720 RepID=A0A814SAZ2_9BILA|nr:unnamed protein product [Adineta steineri]CAF1144672.1 unnamed protein product [Adineta steineri]